MLNAASSCASDPVNPSMAILLLRTEDASIADVAKRVGYGSASTLSTAFSRHVGQAPGRYARAVVATRPFV